MLERAEIHVWSCAVPSADATNHLIRELDRHDERRLRSMADPEQAARFLTSRVLLADLLASYSPRRFSWPIRISRGPGTKPGLRWPSSRTGLEFSVSSSHRLVLIAISYQPVGIDVQWEVELAGLSDDGNPLATDSSWSRAEAVVKLTGEGVDAIDRYDVGGRSPAAVVDKSGTQVDITVADFEVEPGYLAAVAVYGAMRSIVLQHRTLDR